MEFKDPLGFKSFFFAVLGFFIMVVFLNIMNGEVAFEKKKVPSQVKFEAKKLKARQQKKAPPKKKKEKKRTTSKSLKPQMDMSFMAGGLDLGLDLLGLSAGGSRLLSQQGNSVMTEDVVDRLPVVQYREPITYPEAAKEQNLKGEVTLNLLVDEGGKVNQVKLLDSHPPGVFDQVAIESVQSWSFSPAEYQGRYVSVWVKQKLKFQVN